MKNFKLFLILSAVAIFVAACSQTPSANNNANSVLKNSNSTSNTPANTANSQPVDEMAAVRKMYKEKCSTCHKDNGEGGEVSWEGKTFKVPSYKKEGVMKMTDEKMIKVIEDGDDEMPSFKKDLKPEEIANLVKFIRKEFQGK
jgi:mono/diheme cytochrome c family protein